MVNYYIVKIDIGSKQKYIFSSNKLKEVIGASEIIRFITESLGKKVLEFMGKSPEDFDGENQGGVLSEAGGNAMYIFNNEDEAKDFNKVFSKFVVKYFDGIELIIVTKEFDMEKDTITNFYDDIEELIKEKKGRRENQFKRLGYGLVELCSRTKKPAGYEEKEDEDMVRIVSKESKCKLNFYNAITKKDNNEDEPKYYLETCDTSDGIKRRLLEYRDLKSNEGTNCKLDRKGFEFTNKLDYIAGKKDEGSYIGITCIDGNGMGDKIESFKNSIEYNDKISEFNKKYINGFRKLTENIKNKYISAFNYTVQEIIDNYDKYYDLIGFDKNSKILPIRPIILAGDDITFITNGKIAIEATKIFTEYINRDDNKEDFGEKSYYLTTSAGVAIVKRNYPFSRAVKLANALEKNSKNKLRAMKKELKEISKTKDNIFDACLIDWQVSRGDTNSDLLDLRKEELTARPYVITNKNQEDEIRKALNFLSKDKRLEELRKTISYGFNHFDKVMMSVLKSKSRSNLKSFFRTMNLSEVDAKLFSLKYDLQNKVVGEYSVDELNKVLFDVIDVSELYVSLKGVNKHE